MASTPNTKVFDVINDRIIALLDEGVVPWRKPWKVTASGSTRPRNVDGRVYSGINSFFLACLGYADPRFLTFKKAKAMAEAQGNPKGGVRKGQHGYPVVFWKQLVIETENEQGETVKKRVPMLRYFTVFNVEQTEGIEFPALPGVDTSGDEVNPTDPGTLLEDLLASMPNAPVVKHDGGNRAYYQPHTDTIHIPDVRTFASVEGYAETLTHELSHSTGHPSRLNREGIANIDHFGSDQYGREELVAEFGAAFVMAESGIDSPDSVKNMAAYIQNWKAAIKADPKALVVAAGRAEKAANYILGRTPVEEQVEEQKAA